MKKSIFAVSAALCLLLGACGSAQSTPEPAPEAPVQEEVSAAGNYLNEGGYAWLILYEDGTGVYSVQDTVSIVWDEDSIGDPDGTWEYPITRSGDAVIVDLGDGYTDTFRLTDEHVPDLWAPAGGEYDVVPEWYLDGDWDYAYTVTEDGPQYAGEGSESYLTVRVQEDGSFLAAFSLIRDGQMILFDDLPMSILEEPFPYAEYSVWTAEAAGTGTLEADGQAPQEAQLTLSCAPDYQSGGLALVYSVTADGYTEGGDVCIYTPSYAMG